MLEAQKYGKTLCFYAFFWYEVKTILHKKNFHNSIKKHTKMLIKSIKIPFKNTTKRIIVLRPQKTWFWGPSWPRFSSLWGSWGCLRASWAELRTSWGLPWVPKTLHSKASVTITKKTSKNPPQKTGVGGKGTCCLGARGNARFREKWGQNLVFLLFFENSEKQAPVKGGFGGSQMTSLMSCRALYMQIYYA